MAGTGIFPAELDVVPTNPLDVDTGEQQQNLLDWLSATFQLPGAQAHQDVTISGGTITPNRAVIQIETQGAASSDNLDNVAVTNLEAGRIIILYANNTARTVVVRHSQGGSGQLLLADGANFSLDNTEKSIAFVRIGTNWVEIARNYGYTFSVSDAADSVPVANGSGKIDTGYIDKPDAASGWVFLAEQSVSAGSQLAFTSLITSAYNFYRIEVENILVASDANGIDLHVSNNNGSSWQTSSDYDRLMRYGAVGSAFAEASNNSQNQIRLAGEGLLLVGNAGGQERGTAWIEFDRGSVTTPPRFHSIFSARNSGGTNFTFWEVFAQYRTAEAINAVRLLAASGNITMTARLYGMKKTS